jgi:hypothetical protein
VPARRLDPQRAGLEHFDRKSFRVPALNLRHPRANPVARQSSAHEDDEAVEPGDAVAAEGERLDRELELLIAHDRCGHRASLPRG